MTSYFRAPQVNWPHTMNKEKDIPLPQVVQDHKDMARYAEVTRMLDRMDFLLGPGTNVTVANNLYWEFTPITDSIIFEMRVHAKTGGASITLRLRVNGTLVDTITSTTPTVVVRKTPVLQQKVSPSDLFSVDCTAVTGAWQFVTFTVVLEPRYVQG